MKKIESFSIDMRFREVERAMLEKKKKLERLQAKLDRDLQELAFLSCLIGNHKYCID